MLSAALDSYGFLHSRCFCSWFVSCKNCILNALYETVHALTGVVCLNVRLKMNKDIAASATPTPKSAGWVLMLEDLPLVKMCRVSAYAWGFRRASPDAHYSDHISIPRGLNFCFPYSLWRWFSSPMEPYSHERDSGSERLMVQSLWHSTSCH